MFTSVVPGQISFPDPRELPIVRSKNGLQTDCFAARGEAVSLVTCGLVVLWLSNSSALAGAVPV